jgi:hypothetical protein
MSRNIFIGFSIRRYKGASCLFCNYNHENETRRRGDFIANGSTKTSDVELRHIFVNDHLIYGDGDMSRYSTDTNRNPSNL